MVQPPIRNANPKAQLLPLPAPLRSLRLLLLNVLFLHLREQLGL